MIRTVVPGAPEDRRRYKHKVILLPIGPGSCNVFELVEETALMRHAIEMAVQCLFESWASFTDDQLGGLFRHPLGI
jgi:hypothetical protein